MAKEFSELSGYHRAFIAAQHFFFTASAAEKTRVNMSPRSTDLLRVLGPNTVCYLDLTGSGNETAAHIKAGGNLTLMFCAVSGPPLILRLYGRGTVIPLGSNEYDELIAKEYTGVVPLGARQIIRIDFDLVKTSCGFGVSQVPRRPTRNEKRPNKAPEPTPVAVMPRAMSRVTEMELQNQKRSEARVTPATGVAHL